MCRTREENAEDLKFESEHQTDTCIFCGYEFDPKVYRCESGSVYDDDGYVIDSTYCGNAYCPACSSCQGNTMLVSDAHFIAVMKQNRAMYEKREAQRG